MGTLVPVPFHARKRITPRLKRESGRSILRIPAPLDGSAVPESVSRRIHPALTLKMSGQALNHALEQIGNIVPAFPLGTLRAAHDIEVIGRLPNASPTATYSVVGQLPVVFHQVSFQF